MTTCSNSQGLSGLLQGLDVYEALAFEHDADFLEKLVKKGKPTDLTGLSFNASGIAVRWVDFSGQHLLDTIEVGAFLEWAKSHDEALA